VEAVLASFRANPGITSDALSAHLAAAHAAILRQQVEPALSQMRSTVVVLLANAETAICGHVGDSRLYHFRGGAVEFQTVDHSVPGALAASGAIQLDDIRFHEDRNRVLRSLGNDGDVNPVIEELSLNPGDAFLLCTDGFWEYVTEMEMEADSAKAQAPADWLRFMASRLLSRAKPENDNWTAMGVFFGSQTAPVTERHAKGGGTKRRRLSLMEKFSWVAIFCLTATLLVFLGVALYPERVAAILKKRPLGPHRHERTMNPRGKTGKRSEPSEQKPVQ
jgi:hypothetical protein